MVCTIKYLHKGTRQFFHTNESTPENSREKRKANTSKRSRQQEVSKLRAGINQLGKKEKSSFFLVPLYGLGIKVTAVF